MPLWAVLVTAAAVIDCCLLMTSHTFALLVGVDRSNMNAAVADGGYGMQLIARDPLQLRSSWDSYCDAVHRSGGMQNQQPFSTWKFRSDGESKRIIDYIWCVQMTFAAMCSITLLLMSAVCVC